MAEPTPETEARQDGGATDAEPGDPPRPSGRKRWMFWVKLVITVGLLAWIILAVDWYEVMQHMVLLSWWVVAVVLVIWTGCVFGSAMKWQQLLAVHGAHYRLWTLSRWYFIGFFLGQFLPSMIGGDAYRVYKTLDNPAGKTSAVLAIFVERATGMLALLAMGWAAALVLLLRTGDTLAMWLVYLGGGAALAGVATLAVMMRFKLLGRAARHRRCPGKVRVLIERSWEYREHPLRMAYVGLLSFLFHGSRVFLYALLFWAIAEPEGVMEITIVMAVTTVISMLPISLNGYGLVDGSFIYMMAAYSSADTATATAAATTVMVLVRVTTIPVAMIGGVFYFSETGAKSPCEADAAGAVPAEMQA